MDEDTAHQELRMIKSRNNPPEFQPLRLLIVDDNSQVRQDLHLLLGMNDGLEIAGEAANGLEAVQQAVQLSPDVILLDLEMPVLDGYEAAQKLKNLNPASRVVALSVHSYAAARQKAARAGIDEFIEKGAPLDEILRKIGLHTGEGNAP
jgi:DNA-binding NarL/FixJ family response regulator